jgi:hypothetical protein
MLRLLSLFLLLYSGGLPTASPALRWGSIGVIYVLDETPTSVHLKVVFPKGTVENYPTPFPTTHPYHKARLPFVYHGSLVVFDAKGTTAVLDGPVHFDLVFWCENDGGDQYRPEARITVDKSRLAHPLQPVRAIQSAAAFALAGGSETGIEPVQIVPAKTDIRLSGRLTPAGELAAYIRVEPDDAENCDADPPNNLTAILTTAASESPMHCCGP